MWSCLHSTSWSNGALLTWTICSRKASLFWRKRKDVTFICEEQSILAFQISIKFKKTSDLKMSPLGRTLVGRLSFQSLHGGTNSFSYYICFGSQVQEYFQGDILREVIWLNVCYYLKLLGGAVGAVADIEGSPVPTLKLYKSNPNSFLWGFILTREIAVCCHLPLLLPSMSLKMWQPYFIFLLPSVTISL